MPTDPISVTRVEFDEVYDSLAEIGIPLKPDRDQVWRDFAGWRVNYDIPLVALAILTLAPPAQWSSDRVPLTRWTFLRAIKVAREVAMDIAAGRLYRDGQRPTSVQEAPASPPRVGLR